MRDEYRFLGLLRVGISTPTRSLNEALLLIAKSFSNRASLASLIRRPASKCNLGQKIVEKLKKLIKIVFSMEYFTADFSQFGTNAKICLVSNRLKTKIIYAKLIQQLCVCLYSSTVEASSVCKMSKTYLRVRIDDLVLRILVGCVMPSSIISISENVIFHLQRRKLQPNPYWRENDMI